jgi:hypothetical protein
MEYINTIGKNIVAIAANEIGYMEYPENSNKTKYGKWFGLDSVSWCGIFVSWVYAKAGAALENIGFLKGFAGCQTAVAYFKKTKQITINPVEGDIVFFDWNSDGRYDHTGIFVKDIDGTYFESIEGNTSSNNQSNGGIVMRRKRLYKIAIFAHPKCLSK